MVETDLREAAEERYLSYALSVITSRALPDVRDGLKPPRVNGTVGSIILNGNKHFDFISNVEGS